MREQIVDESDLQLPQDARIWVNKPDHVGGRRVNLALPRSSYAFIVSLSVDSAATRRAAAFILARLARVLCDLM